MGAIDKAKSWIKENAPMFQALYENKYVGMAYDRFGSLPPQQQKQVILGTFGGFVGIIFLYLFISYLSLWSTQGKGERAREGIGLLTDYQGQMRNKAGEMAKLDQNAAIAGQGQLKQHLLDIGRTATISTKMMEIEEKGEGGGDSPGSLKTREATVVLNRVNLNQLSSFVRSVEFGIYNMSVTALKITNDDKLRGYMRVDLTVSAVVPQSTEAIPAPAGGGT